MAVQVITFSFPFFFCWSTITASIREWVGTRDVFSFAAAWPNGPSEKCANQLAQLTSAMVPQPVNLERRGGWGGVGRGGAMWGEWRQGVGWHKHLPRQLKGRVGVGQTRRGQSERASDGKTLLMLGLCRVEGSIRESARDTEPWDKENPITAIVSGIVGEKIIIISHGAHDNDSFFKLYYYNYLTTGCRDFFLFF